MRSYPRIISFALAICLFTLSCKKDKNHIKRIENNNIIGTWKMVKVGYDKNENYQPDTDELYESNIPFYNQIFVLNSDQTGSISYTEVDTAYAELDSAGNIIPTHITFSWLLVNDYIQIHQPSGNFHDYVLYIYSVSPSQLIRQEAINDKSHINCWYVYTRLK